MIPINQCKEDLKTITGIIQKSLEVDVAIFDLNNKLVASTDGYLEQKGKTVHAPSVREAVDHGNVMVNNPGHMPACSGCRFLGNCPAKIEILKSIIAGTTPLGVMTLTTFTQEGHERITKDTRSYVDALNMFSDWIAQRILQQDRTMALDRSQKTLAALMDISRDAMLTIDSRARVLQANEGALKFFSACDLYTRSAFQILPEPVVDKILEAGSIKNTRVKISREEVFVSARPIFVHDRFAGSVLSLSRTGPDSGQTKVPSGLSTDKASHGLDTLSNIIGKSPAMALLKKNITRLKHSSSTILVTGPTGTGKGLVAKTLHQTSIRSQGPFVPVNCASIPDALFESELFGYEEGAFTGAKKGGKPGRFELARGGTLFLDEIGEMPIHLQVKLLNVLQDQALQRVGGTREIPVDVRVIAATNQDLEQSVKNNKFRADLFFRLNVIPLDLPPLNQRREDIEMLALSFLKNASRRAGRDIEKIAPEVTKLFHWHDWPGNIRELQNIIEYSANMEDGPAISLASLPPRFSASIKDHPDPSPDNTLKPATDPARAHTGPEPPPIDIKLRAMTAEAKAIHECMDRFGHDMEGKKKAARELGISLRTLYRKLKISKG